MENDNYYHHCEENDDDMENNNDDDENDERIREEHLDWEDEEAGVCSGGADERNRTRKLK